MLATCPWDAAIEVCDKQHLRAATQWTPSLRGLLSVSSAAVAGLAKTLQLLRYRCRSWEGRCQTLCLKQPCEHYAIGACM